jgi:hypothetical protein
MQEQEPEYIGNQELIHALETSGDLSKKHIAESLKELSLPDAFRCRSTSKELGVVQAMRIIRKEETSTDLSFYIFSTKNMAGKKSQLLNNIRDETRKILPRTVRMTKDLENLVLNTLAERQLKTVAAMAILRGSVTDERIVKVFYPKVFMNVEPSIPPSQKDNAAFAIAAYFLKKRSY